MDLFNKNIKLGLFIFVLVASMGCTTTRVSVLTNPSGANVYAKPVGSAQPTLMGQTPLQFTNKELEKEFNGSGALVLEIQKEGFKTDTLFITELSKIDLNIVRDLAPKRDLEVQTWLNGHIGSMFEVKRLVQAQRYEEALRIVRELKKETPMVATLYEMEGGIYLMQREYKSALDSYRVALKYDNERTEAFKMVKYLEQTFGFAKEVDIADTKLPPPASTKAKEERLPSADETITGEGSEK